MLSKEWKMIPSVVPHGVSRVVSLVKLPSVTPVEDKGLVAQSG